MFQRLLPWALSSVLLFAPVALGAEPPTLHPTQDLGAASQQIPAGAKLKIAFLTALDAQKATPGDAFLAQAAEDLWTGNQLILPKGTEIRGRVLDSRKSGLFSKGAMLRLSFDHLVMPSGELNPLNLQLDTLQTMFNREKNALYTDPGIGAKLNTSVDKGIAQYRDIRENGMKNATAHGGTVNKLLASPITAIAGFAAGTAVTTANAAKSVFGKGESIVIQPGDTLILDFSQSATLPVQ